MTFHGHQIQNSYLMNEQTARCMLKNQSQAVNISLPDRHSGDSDSVPDLGRQQLLPLVDQGSASMPSTKCQVEIGD